MSDRYFLLTIKDADSLSEDDISLILEGDPDDKFGSLHVVGPELLRSGSVGGHYFESTVE